MPELIIGIDAEWQTGSKDNSVLSYQWYGIDEQVLVRHSISDLSKPETKTTEAGTLGQQCTSDEYKGRAWPEMLCWPSISFCRIVVIDDFGFVKTRIDLVQGTSLVTLHNAITKNCYDRSRNAHPVRIHIADTMLLAPDGGKKLDDLGDMGLEKLNCQQTIAKIRCFAFCRKDQKSLRLMPFETRR